MKKPAAPTTPPLAYSYVRFSSPEQAQGDSLRRQTEKAKAWCEKNGIPLDTSTTLHDLGKSAYLGEHRKNADRFALAAFLKLVQEGRVPRGSYLVIENLDRLSREHERAALRLWMDLLDQGVNIVQLTPETVFRHERSDMTDIIRAIIELSRGHSESRMKSERMGEAWGEKRKQARANGKVLTRRLPAWVELHDGTLRLYPERAAVVKRIFQLAASGYGHVLIVKRLNQEKVPPFGVRIVRPGRKRPAFAGEWTRTYVALILRDRRALGEYQPRLQDGTPDGDPIKNYYPAAITEQEWHAARAGAAERERRPGRTSGHVNLFAGLLRDARSGESYYVAVRNGRTRRGDGSGRHRVLFNQTAASGSAPYYSFPLAAFEQAVLSCLKEIDPHEILNGDDGPDESLALAGELAVVESKIAELEAELLEGDVAALARVLRRLEEKKRRLAADLAEARQRAAHPLSESWGEAQGLLDALDAAPDPPDARLRLRSALRRIVDSIWLLVVPSGRDRLCAVQIWFADGKRQRSYLILHKPAKANRSSRQEAQTAAFSLASAAVPSGLDLRKRDHARRLEKALVRLPVEALAGE